MRLAAGIWVAAYLARLGQQAIPAYVARRGDATAGAVIVKVATMDGRATLYQRSVDLMMGARAWIVLTEGEEVAVDAAASRQAGFDPDLWIVEVEDRQGRHLLDEPGLD